VTAELHVTRVGCVFYGVREHKRQGNTLAKYGASEQRVGEGSSRRYVAPGSSYFMSQLRKKEEHNTVLKEELAVGPGKSKVVVNQRHGK